MLSQKIIGECYGKHGGLYYILRGDGYGKTN